MPQEYRIAGKWQGQRDSNSRPAVLETAALPTELYPYKEWPISIYWNYNPNTREMLDIEKMSLLQGIITFYDKGCIYPA